MMHHDDVAVLYYKTPLYPGTSALDSARASHRAGAGTHARY
jgi:hypothetical protein